MRCPYCHADDDKVIDSRSTEGGRTIRRRRHCNECSKRFTTYEHVEETVRLTVVKKDGTRVPYNREKVLAGLQKAAYKRPISAQQLSGVVDEIEEALFRRGEKEVSSTDIGMMVVEKLKRLDQVAFVRFASVYMSISNVDDLLEEIEQVRANHQPPPAPDQGQLF